MTEPLDDLAALGALGVLDAAEQERLAQQLRDGDPVAVSAATEFSEAVALLAQSLDPVEPPDSVRRTILTAIGMAGGGAVRASEGGWREIRAGVQIRKLASDRARNSVTILLRLDPGAFYPGHAHEGAEQSFVVEGSCRFGDAELAAGDFYFVPPGGRHGDVVSDAGCTLLIIADYHDFAAA